MRLNILQEDLESLKVAPAGSSKGNIALEDDVSEETEDFITMRQLSETAYDLASELQNFKSSTV
jgi:hypothetical protein